tara:strand:- start:285 stop:623 length:339 start_codon:yes stop_codon:yes gene_type:complete
MNKATLKYKTSDAIENTELPIMVQRGNDIVPSNNPAFSKRSLLSGVLGLAKSTLNIGIARESTVRARRAICESCDSRKGNSCGECGCYITHKTRLEEQTCPLGKWLAESQKM